MITSSQIEWMYLNDDGEIEPLLDRSKQFLYIGKIHILNINFLMPILLLNGILVLLTKIPNIQKKKNHIMKD